MTEGEGSGDARGSVARRVVQPHQVDHVAHAQLLHDARLVDLHGARADPELRGDLAVVQALHDEIEHLPLAAGRYYLWVAVFEPGTVATDLVPWHPARAFEVIGPQLEDTPRAVVRLSPVQVDHHWDFERI